MRGKNSHILVLEFVLQMTTNYPLSSSTKKFNESTYTDILDNKKVMLPLNSRYRYSRLDHTNDVKSVALKIANIIKKKKPHIDENKLSTMVEWHDVGHCPYAHAGEELLNKLLSENDKFYYDSFFSGYKHNLLSAKILLDEHKDISWDIVDGIIKHSSVLPKNFNMKQVMDGYNLLKLNYVFGDEKAKDKYGTPLNKSWHTFINNFFYKSPCKGCKYAKPDLKVVVDIVNNKFTLCSREKSSFNYCCLCEDTKKDGKHIASYLLYPYSLTFEGAILYMADEIACLANDIFYYFSFVNKEYEEKNKKHIIRLQVINALNLAEAKFKKIKYIGEFCNIVRELIDNPTEERRDFFIEKLVNNIIPNKYESIGKIDGISIYIAKQTGNFCQPLLKLKRGMQLVVAQIKKAIYDVIHKDDAIDKDNKDGRTRLGNAFSEYYDNPNVFLGLIDVKSIAYDLKQIAKMKGLIVSPYANLEDLIVSCKDEVAKHKPKHLDASKLLNAYRREIIFYLARLKEEDLGKILP